MNCQVLKKRSHGRCFAVLSVAVLLGAVSTKAVAATNFFVPDGGGLTGLWSDPLNWTLGHLPIGPTAAGEQATIHAGREATIDVDNGNQFWRIRLADNDVGPVDGTLNILPGAGIDLDDIFYIGLGGAGDHKGVVNQSGGSVSVGTNTFLAFGATHTGEYNMSGGSLSTGNLWFRFGAGTFTHTDGVVSASSNLVLGEGGTPFQSSLYDMQGGTLNVAGIASIGSASGGELFPGSDLGSMNISGGIATFGDVLFGTDPTDVINISGTGILRVDQANYSEADALADIGSGKILGSNLIVSTVSGASPLTQITAVPEPAGITLLLLSVAAVTLLGRKGPARC